MVFWGVPLACMFRSLVGYVKIFSQPTLHSNDFWFLINLLLFNLFIFVLFPLLFRLLCTPWALSYSFKHSTRPTETVLSIECLNSIDISTIIPLNHVWVIRLQIAISRGRINGQPLRSLLVFSMVWLVVGVKPNIAELSVENLQKQPDRLFSKWKFYDIGTRGFSCKPIALFNIDKSGRWRE